LVYFLLFQYFYESWGGGMPYICPRSLVFVNSKSKKEGNTRNIEIENYKYLFNKAPFSPNALGQSKQM
jgi:hypothetical protein